MRTLPQLRGPPGGKVCGCQHYAKALSQAQCTLLRPVQRRTGSEDSVMRPLGKGSRATLYTTPGSIAMQNWVLVVTFHGERV